MDLEFLGHLLLIEKEKSITRAAEKLFISQSALNQQLTKLENTLKTPLFIRNRGNWTVTEAGNLYLKAAKDILFLHENAVKQIERLSDQKKHEISIGLIPERGVSMFTAVYPRFHALYPEITLEPYEISVRQILKRINEGDLDMGLVTLTKDQMDENVYHTLGTEEILLAVPKNHLLAKEGSIDPACAPAISLSLFSDASFILIYKDSTMRGLIEESFLQAGFHPKVLFTTSSISSMKGMVKVGLGCSLIPKSYADYDEEISWFHLDPAPKWLVTMCTKKGVALNDAENTLLVLCKDYWMKKL